MPTQLQKAEAFRALHARPGGFRDSESVGAGRRGCWPRRASRRWRPPASASRIRWHPRQNLSSTAIMANCRALAERLTSRQADLGIRRG